MRADHKTRRGIQENGPSAKRLWAEARQPGSVLTRHLRVPCSQPPGLAAWPCRAKPEEAKFPLPQDLRHCLGPRIPIVSGDKSGQPPPAWEAPRDCAAQEPPKGSQGCLLFPLRLPGTSTPRWGLYPSQQQQPQLLCSAASSPPHRIAWAPEATWLGLGLTALANCHTLLPGCQPWRLVQTNLGLHKYPGQKRGGSDVVQPMRKFELRSKK